MQKNYRAFFEEIKNAPREKISLLKKKSFALGKMKSAWVAGLAKEGIALKSLEIIQRGEDLMHARRPNKTKRLDDDFWQNLPAHLENAHAVLLDKTKMEMVILLIYPHEKKNAKKLTLQINKFLKENEKFANVLRTGGVVDPQGLQGANYVLLEGKMFWDKKS